MKLILIANCHVQPLAYLLELNPKIDAVIQIPLHLVGTEHYLRPIKIIEESRDEYVVLQFPEQLEKINFTDSARLRFKNILSFTNIYFTGYHPDCCYLGGMGCRVVSPLGDYHSKLCYLAFAKGYNASECLNLFRPDVFERLGYYDEWKKSSHDLLQRDKNIDIKFAETFLTLSEKFLTLLTFNHPTALSFLKLSELIITSIGLQNLSLAEEAYPNFLYSNAVWPIYPGLNIIGDVSDRANYNFKSPDNIGKKIYSLGEFIVKSYANYTSVSLEKINKPYFHDLLIDRI